MSVRSVVARQRVADLDAAVPFYEQLTGEPANRFAFSGARLAAVGPFLLFEAPGETGDLLARVSATVVVDDLDATGATVESLGGAVLVPPTPTPNGRRAVLRHPDGSVFEYVGR